MYRVSCSATSSGGGSCGGNAAVGQMSARRREAVLNASSRLGLSSFVRRLDLSTLGNLTQYENDTILLLAHYVAADSRDSPLSGLPAERLADMTKRGRSSWPASYTLLTQLLLDDGRPLTMLRGCPDSALFFIDETFEFPRKHAQTVLEDPVEFSLRLIALAERSFSNALNDSSLHSVAISGGRFTE